MASTVSINDFPMEILQLIFGNCKGKALLAISAVCRRWEKAVQKLIPPRVCLKVSDQTSESDFILIRESNREYIRFQIDWTVTNENAANLERLLDLCQERFRVEWLYLEMSLSQTIAYFFMKRQHWLHTLTELHLNLASEGDHLAGCEISLPSLKQLSFFDPDFLGSSGGTWSLDVPELRQLEVAHVITMGWTNLFGSLKLKSCTKLVKLKISRLARLDPQSVEVYGPLLHNLKVLMLSECYGPAVKLICDKCPNLTDLSVEIFPVLGEMTLQISPVLSQNLENLRLSYQNAGVMSGHGQVVFQKLRRLALFDLQLEDSTSFIAPQLTELSTNIHDLSSSSGGQLNLPDSKQLRTMRIAIFDPHMATAMKPHSSNVTELYLWLHDKLLESRDLLEYLELFPNLSRLTLNMDFLKVMDCSFVKNFANLESFSAHKLVMDSTDLNCFAGLKSLILCNCYIGWNPNGEQVLLTSLEYFRVERVTIYNITGDKFPIRINDRQAPIKMVSSQEKAKVFTSRKFKTNFDDEPRFEFMD